MSQTSDSKMQADRVTALKIEAEKRKRSQQDALNIVWALLEQDVSELDFTEKVSKLNKSYYNDVVDERSISKLCGYALCAKQINVPQKQQYHISTKSNKVYDVTDRKKFCSNFCYKASKYVEAQLSDLPIWTDFGDVNIKLLNISDCSAKPGEDIRFDDRELIKAELAVIENDKKVDKQEETPTKSDCVESKLKHLENLLEKRDTLLKQLQNEPNEIRGSCDENKSRDKKGDDNEAHKFNENRTSSDKYFSEKNDLEAVDTNSQIANSDTVAKSKYELNLLKQLQNEPNEIRGSYDENKSRDKKGDDSEAHKFNENRTSSDKYFSEKTDLEAVDTNTHTVANSKKESNLKSSAFFQNIQTAARQKDAIPKHRIHMNAFEHIKYTLDCWKTEKTIEFLNEKSSLYQDMDDISEEIEKRLRFSDQLDEMVESPEKKVPDLPPKNVDYEKLAKDTNLVSLKVKEFFGDALGGEILKKNDENHEKENQMEGDPVVPCVDSKSHNAIRKKIVLDGITKSLLKILPNIGLTIGEISTSLKQLVSTFKLSSTNVTFKPGVWNLLGVILIYILATKDKKITDALETEISRCFLEKLFVGFKITEEKIKEVVGSLFIHERSPDLDSDDDDGS